MYDKLVFVEGSSDHEVLVELVKKAEGDFAAKVGFVRMGGSTNMHYFSSETILNLLSKRQIPVMFILDSDETQSSDIEKIRERLGSRAVFHSLKRREIENYLLIARAVHGLIRKKMDAGTAFVGEMPSVSDVNTALIEDAKSLKERVKELHIKRELLKSEHVQRINADTLEGKLSGAIDHLQKRLAQFASDCERIGKQIDTDWDKNYLSRAPGEEILKRTLARYGLTFRKEKDAVALAEMIQLDEIDAELRGVLNQIRG